MVVRGLNFEFAPLLHELRRLHEGVACGVQSNGPRRIFEFVVQEKERLEGSDAEDGEHERFARRGPEDTELAAAWTRRAG